MDHFIVSSPFIEELSFNKNRIHIRLTQRNGRKSLTTVEGLPGNYAENLLKQSRKLFSCGGKLIKTENGLILSLQGDHRQNLYKLLISEGLYNKDEIFVHGY